MKGRVSLARWKSKGRYIVVEHASGNAVNPLKRRASQPVHGFFWDSKPSIYCYKLDGMWWLRLGKNLIRMDDEALSVNLRVRWPYLIASIEYPEGNSSIEEFSPIKLLFPKIDLTYDNLDFTSDFFGAYINDAFLDVRK